MSENINTKGNAIEYLKWSMIATAVVTSLFILVDVFVAHGIDGATNFADGLTKLLKLGYSYFVSALVTSVLSLLLQAIIAKNGEIIGVRDQYTPHFLVALFVYTVLYFIYLTNYAHVFFAILYLLISIVYVYFLLNFWVDKITINLPQGSCKNTPI